MLLKALLFSLVTFAIAMAVSMIVAGIIKAIGAWVHNRDNNKGAAGAKS